MLEAMQPVTVYVTTWCPYCVRAKRLLDRKGVPYEEVNLEGNPELRMRLSRETGMRTVPMIFIGDACIGGSDELHALEASGQLDALLSGEDAPPASGTLR